MRSLLRAPELQGTCRFAAIWVATLMAFGASVVQADTLSQVLPRLWGKNGIILADPNLGATASFNQSSLDSLNRLSSGISSAINVANIGSSTSSFTFDVQQAVFVRSTESLGPTLAERAETIGEGKLNVAWTYTRADFTTYKGDNLNDINLILPSSDRCRSGAPRPQCPGEPPSPGQPAFEQDNLWMNLDLQLAQDQILFYGKYGITPRWDVGLILPVIHTSFRVSSTATILRNARNSASFNNFCLPNGVGGSFYNGSNGYNPVGGGPCAINANISTINATSTRTSTDESKTEFGDLLLRTKYNFVREQGNLPDMAVLGAVRFDTGDQDNFSGQGNTGFQGYFVASKKLGMFTPNFNLGAELTTSGGSTDIWRLAAGTEFSPDKAITFSVDVLGEQSFNGNGINDKLWDIGFGVKVNPWSTLALIGNFIIPLNQNQGLRTDVTWTVGLEYTF